LRTFDDVEHLEQILAVLFDHTIPSVDERAQLLDVVINSYGKLVNPAYAKAVARISMGNVLALATGKEPGSYPPAGAHFVGRPDDS
jgi:hypothetical protein